MPVVRLTHRQHDVVPDNSTRLRPICRARYSRCRDGLRPVLDPHARASHANPTVNTPPHKPQHTGRTRTRDNNSTRLETETNPPPDIGPSATPGNSAEQPSPTAERDRTSHDRTACRPTTARHQVLNGDIPGRKSHPTGLTTPNTKCLSPPKTRVLKTRSRRPASPQWPGVASFRPPRLCSLCG
jgi:hypothetical protein